MNEKVFYCPECDGLHVRRLNKAFLFKDEIGPFIMVYEIPVTNFKLHKLYLMGDL